MKLKKKIRSLHLLDNEIVVQFYRIIKSKIMYELKNFRISVKLDAV